MIKQPKVILPQGKIGIIGGGQLGRMMAIAARQMGYFIEVLEPSKNGPLEQISDTTYHAAYDDVQSLTKMLQSNDVVTYEFENVPYQTIRKLESVGNLPQGAMPLIVTSHRLREKLAIKDAGYEVAPFLAVMSTDELRYAVKKIGYPSILKTSSGGYDGKGQWVLRSDEDLEQVLPIVNNNEYVLEGFVDFDLEVSVIVTRSILGEIESFPVTENIHKNQILHVSIAPARISKELQIEAENIARGLIEKLDFVGTLAIEMFVTKNGIIINELAPRPHNSGHWTIDGANVSQFEQHIRAICGLPLIKPVIKTNTVMVNLLGQHVDYAYKMWQKPQFSNAKIHMYGKAEMIHNRKVGHINFMSDDQALLEKIVESFLTDFPE